VANSVVIVASAKRVKSLIAAAAGYSIGYLTGGLTEDGFNFHGGPAFVLFALIILYFVVFSRYLGGTLWQRLLGVR